MATVALSPSFPRIQPPGPRGYPLLGVLPALRNDPLRFLLQATQVYGDIVRLQVGPRPVILVSSPDGIRHVLGHNYGNYRKSEFYQKLVPLFGRGVIMAEGEEWKRQRRMMQPAFHKERLAEMSTAMTASADERVAHWEAASLARRPVDIGHEMMALALDIVVRCIFGTGMPADAATALGAHVAVMLEETERRVWAMVDMPSSVPTPRNLRLQRSLAAVEAFLDEHLQGPTEGPMLTMLRGARDATGAGFTDQEIKDEVKNLLLAGHETTGSALAWTWYLLSKHPTIRERLYDEVRTGLRGHTPGIADLPKLRFTKMVFQEAMRLYPPAWTMSRVAVEADEIEGFHVPAGATIMLCPYVAHRNPKHWRNPEGFDPERFNPELTETRPPQAYFPFGAGPRKCIGEQFAYMEAVLAIARIAQRYELNLVPGHPVEPKPMISLRPGEGLPMLLERVVAMN